MTLADLRKRAGLTQKQAAEAAGIVVNVYQKYEYGIVHISRAAAETALALAKAFGATIEELLDTE